MVTHKNNRVSNWKRLVLLLVLLLLSVVFLFHNFDTDDYIINDDQPSNPDYLDLFSGKINVPDNQKSSWRNLSANQIVSLSKLGRILYLDDEIPESKFQEKTFKIVVWKYGKSIYNRHIKHFTKNKFDPFEKCSVRNCEISYEDTDAASADIVIVHLHRTQNVNDLPPRDTRDPNQIWAFLSDESPLHTFMTSAKIKDFNGIFNWSMTYRMNSDIPVPYGRTVARKGQYGKDEFYSWLMSKKSDVLIAILTSNCVTNNHRLEYIKELQKYIAVDVYGSCGTLKCAGHFQNDCPALNDYMFYLSFENSNCDEYITEKVWYNAYAKGAIPIVMGASRDNYSSLLPPGSYINVDEHATPRSLATYLTYLVNAHDKLAQYQRWRQHYAVLNEHGYFQTDSFHYCRVCEALNYNDRTTRLPHVYDDLERYWTTGHCYARWDA